MLVVIENGYGKRIRVSEIRRTKPGAVGVKVSKVPVAAALVVEADDDLLIATALGKIERVTVAPIPIGRRPNRKRGAISKGVRIVRLEPGGRVAQVASTRGVETASAARGGPGPTGRLGEGR